MCFVFCRVDRVCCWTVAVRLLVNVERYDRSRILQYRTSQKNVFCLVRALHFLYIVYWNKRWKKNEGTECSHDVLGSHTRLLPCLKRIGQPLDLVEFKVYSFYEACLVWLDLPRTGDGTRWRKRGGDLDSGFGKERKRERLRRVSCWKECSGSC